MALLDDNVPQPWMGRTTLVFALTAASLGLGNIFRLPYLMGEHGGAPFFAVYVLFLLLFTIPMLVAEVMLGSHGRGSPVAAIRWVADQAGVSTFWSGLGVLQIIVGLLLAVEMSIAVMWFVERAGLLQQNDLAAASPQDVAEQLARSLGSFERQWWFLFPIVATLTFMGAVGVRWVMVFIGWIVFPAFAVAMLGLVGYVLANGDIQATDEFLFARRWDQLELTLFVDAGAAALTTLAIGSGVGLCFGARTPRKVSLLRSVTAAALLDVTFSMMMAIIINGLLFAVNIAPAEGLGIPLIGLPYAFANLPLGDWWGMIFFSAISLACFATGIAVIEPAILWLKEVLAWQRALVSALLGTLILLVGSFALQQGGVFLAGLDALLALLIPLSALAVALFVGWRVPRPIVRGELYREPRWLFLLWWLLIRLIVPTMLLLIIAWRWLLV
jgi:NSS family neurotransmitter:Na+ symporter